MSNEVHKYIGYHGTSKEAADLILKSNYFYSSRDEEEWLGEGVYFFEDDSLQALDWCKKVKKFNGYCILKSDIEAEKVVNMIDKKTYREFSELSKHIKGKYKTRSDHKPRKLINSVIFNIMYNIEKYDIVRAAFPIMTEEVADRSNIVPMQIQLCVRNKECIKSVKEEIL